MIIMATRWCWRCLMVSYRIHHSVFFCTWSKVSTRAFLVSFVVLLSFLLFFSFIINEKAKDTGENSILFVNKGEKGILFPTWIYLLCIMYLGGLYMEPVVEKKHYVEIPSSFFLLPFFLCLLHNYWTSLNSFCSLLLLLLCMITIGGENLSLLYERKSEKEWLP